MAWYEETTWCDGCGVEITWVPVQARERNYCCRDCSQSYSCTCGDRMELDEEQRGAEAASTPANSGYLI